MARRLHILIYCAHGARIAAERVNARFFPAFTLASYSVLLSLMQIKHDQIKKFILESGLISKSDFLAAEKQADEKGAYIGDVLVSAGKLSDTDLKRIEAYVLGISFVSLVGEKIEYKTLSLIPESIARNHNIIAYKQAGDTLEVAMLDVDDLPTIDFIKKKVALKIVPRLTDAESIKAALLQYQKSLKADFDAIIKKESASLKTVRDESDDADRSEKELKDMAEDLPIVKIVDTLISHAIIQRASDIHIEPGEESVVVRYRIDGILRDAMTLPKDTASGITARIKVLSNLKLDEKRLPQDGRFKIENEGERVSFRVSTLPTYFGEKTVMRLLRENSKGYNLETLGFHGDALEAIHDGMKQRTGMLLAAGPTGSGKTTTLYTMLDILNTPDVNISTVEDPIEYQMPRINQTQVKPEIGLTFANGLRALLRQDPDIVMVGEIRDGETARIAVQAALTGHLVLSTLHTNDAAAAAPRLLDMGVEPYLLASVLVGVVGQRLVRTLCPSCRGTAEIGDTLARRFHATSTTRVGRAVGCTACRGTGYAGRTMIAEVMAVNDQVRRLVLERADGPAIAAAARGSGMRTMAEDGFAKASAGVTSLEEVLRAAEMS